ncbi:MAG TPA: AAA family ATPase [Solirubrobacteraceae bacterium]|jgi:DNA-binding CsgD family transcriptional regulator
MDETLVGRDRVLGATHTFLANLQEGPRALILEGEAGIGKTEVWRSTLDAGRRSGCVVLEAVAEQVEARMSFVGLADLIGGRYGEFADALPARQRDALDHALLRGTGDAGKAPDARAIGTALRSAIAALAQRAPVLVAIDDLQWLDAASADAVAFAVRRLEGHAVGVLVTARTPPAATDRLGLRRALGEARSPRVRLGPLDAPALGAVLERRLGFSYRRPVLRRVAVASDGNPLFALEIARALGPQPALSAGQPLPVPEEFHELVADRVGRLSASGRRALLASAALSHPTVELIERASSADGLEAAELAGLLRAHDGRVAFTHPLYASAVYASTTGRQRQALHRRLAELVDDPEEHAHHLGLATPRPDEGVAAMLEAAADLARARGGWSSAGDLLEHACRLSPGSDPDSANRRAIRAAEHHVHAGDRPRARALLEETLGRAPQGPLRCDALRLLADVRYNENSFAEARELLEAALAETSDPAVAVPIELSVAYVLCHHLGTYEAALPYAERALAAALELGDDGLVAEALGVKSMVHFLNGRGVDWAAVDRAVELDDSSRVMALDLRPGWIAALLRVYTGRLDEGRARLHALKTDAERSGDESDLAQILFWLAWVESLSGDLSAALARGQEALVQATVSGSEQSRAWAFAQLAVVQAQIGDPGTCRRSAASATEICMAVGTRLPLLWSSAGLGLLELSLGDLRAAWAAVAPLSEALELEGIGEPTLVFLPIALEALIGLGELDRAERLLDDFEARARVLDRVWALATAARCRGVLLAERGDLTGAQAALDRALAADDRQSMPFELARTLLVQGQVRRRARARRLARRSLERALELFEGMGATIWAQRARTELEPLMAARRDGVLTSSEQRVSELAAAGLSNKEIAGTLFIAVHTVEVHLSHAYAKLGIRSRAQLASRVSPAADLEV